MNPLHSRKLWLAAMTCFVLVHIAACLFTMGAAWPSRDLAAMLISAALTVLALVRDITVAYLGANVIGHVIGAVENGMTERRKVADDTLEEE